MLRLTKAATGRNKAGAALRFRIMIPKSGNRFLEKIMVKQKRCRPNRVPPMRQDRLGEG
jgi:hypothetical protein